MAWKTKTQGLSEISEYRQQVRPVYLTGLICAGMPNQPVTDTHLHVYERVGGECSILEGAAATSI